MYASTKPATMASSVHPCSDNCDNGLCALACGDAFYLVASQCIVGIAKQPHNQHLQALGWLCAGGLETGGEVYLCETPN